MTTTELSLELVNEIFKRQNGLCALTGKKLELENSTDFLAYSINPDSSFEDMDNFVLIWKDADFSTLQNLDLPGKQTRKYQLQFGNFQNYHSKQKVEDISTEFELIKNLSLNDDKLKVSIQQTKNLQKILQSLNIDEEHASNLCKQIQEHLSSIDERFSNIRNQINEESAKFFDSFNKKIEELKSVPTNWQSLRSSRQKLLNLQNEISNTKSKVSKNTIEELKKHIANALTLIAQKQISERENYEMECSDNYLQLKHLIDNILPNIEKTNDYSKIRQDLIEIQKQISKKTLKRNHQEELYQSIRNGFEILSSIQDKDKTLFMEEANTNYEQLKPIIENAINIATTTDTFKEAREILIAAQASIKGLSLTKEQRDDLYGQIRTVFEKINVQQEEERGEFIKVSEENFAKLLNKINLEKEKLNDNPHFKTIRENLLTIQSEIRVWKLKTDHRNKLYDTLKNAFASLDEKRNSFFENQQQQKKSKSDSIIRNLKEKLTKLEEAVSIDKNELVNLENKLNEQLTNLEKDSLTQEIDSIKLMIEEKEKRIEETKERLNN